MGLIKTANIFTRNRRKRRFVTDNRAGIGVISIKKAIEVSPDNIGYPVLRAFDLVNPLAGQFSQFVLRKRRVQQDIGQQTNPFCRSLLKNSAVPEVKSNEAATFSWPPMKSSSEEICVDVLVTVPFRSRAAVMEATPAFPAGSATEPAFTMSSKLMMGTSCCSIRSTV